MIAHCDANKSERIRERFCETDVSLRWLCAAAWVIVRKDDAIGVQLQRTLGHLAWINQRSAGAHKPDVRALGEERDGREVGIKFIDDISLRERREQHA